MSRPARVAVLGAGPAGVYAADALTRTEPSASVDVLDKLPAPFGLVRYGVAPDHPKIKSVSAVLARVLQRPGVRFLGNVDFGADLDLDDLRRHYHAVVVATGTPRHNLLGVPGEDLPGSSSAAELVDWYNGHPDAGPEFPLDARQVAVIGAGNVALDAARMLAVDADELASTDVPDHVLAALRSSKVTDVYVIGRRGPAQAKFTPLELREFDRLPGAVALTDPDDLVLDADDEQLLAKDRRLRSNVELLRTWSRRPAAEADQAPRRVHFRFWRRPVAVLGETAVSGCRLQRTRDAGPGGPPAGAEETLPVQAMLTAIGYRGAPLPGVPFDEDTGRIRHEAGRVLDESGRPVPGLYVAGWAKRGPTGVIGTNKSDATETARSVLADADTLPTPQHPGPGDVDALLAGRGVTPVTWRGWVRLDAYEQTYGEPSGRSRVKLHERGHMLAICQAPDAAAAAPDRD